MVDSDDWAVQITSDEATASKAYAVTRGYWNDQFIKFFNVNMTCKTPEINRGYFIRTQSFRAIISSFLKDTSQNCQIINLGAGMDTLFFHLLDMDLVPEKYVEIDLLSNVQKKSAIIERRKLLERVYQESVKVDTNNLSKKCEDQLVNEVHNDNFIKAHFVYQNGTYHLISFDLRDSFEELITFLCFSPFGPKCSLVLPTLFLAECVLVYMSTESSRKLIESISSRFTRVSFLNYEQVNMEDQFGKIMIRNFRARSCELLGLDACQSLTSQEQRFLTTGWSNAKAWTVNQVYQAFSNNTRQRIGRLEVLDDLEVTGQLYDHFCLVLASNDEELYSKCVNLSEPLSIIN